MIKKQLIMEKALELFAKQGFEATSVKQITDHCGISKGAFYLSFKSKDELILALIDHFMQHFTADIDYVVKNVSDKELVYRFYTSMFDSFHKHSDFAKLLIKEQTYSFSKELLLKIRYYDSLVDKTILLMIERVFGDSVDKTKFDLLYCIKGFLNVYSGLFLFHSVPLDVDLLARSLEEKTRILASETTIPFITQPFIKPVGNEIPEEQLHQFLDQVIDEMDDSLEKDSLLLLKQELLEPSLQPAIINGLLENIRNHPQCKWIAYLLRKNLQH